MSDYHTEQHRGAVEGRTGADRMAMGLPCIPDKERGDMDTIADLRLRLAEAEQARDDNAYGVECWKQQVVNRDIHIKHLGEEFDRIKRTVEFQERQYLAAHGGSWGECKYQSEAKALATALGRAMEEVRAARVHHNLLCKAEAKQRELHPPDGETCTPEDEAQTDAFEKWMAARTATEADPLCGERVKPS